MAQHTEGARSTQHDTGSHKRTQAVIHHGGSTSVSQSDTICVVPTLLLYPNDLVYSNRFSKVPPMKTIVRFSLTVLIPLTCDFSI